MSFNVLELLAIQLNLLQWTILLARYTVRVQFENATPVVYLGGPESPVVALEVDYILCWI